MLVPFDTFIEALYKAGWESPCDAQWDNTKALHKEWFPASAKLDTTLLDLEKAYTSLAVEEAKVSLLAKALKELEELRKLAFQ